MLSTMTLASTSFQAPVAPVARGAINMAVGLDKSAAKSTEFCYGLPGAIAPAGEFDPANLLEGVSKEEVYRWREAEITHGRVGMLAAAGFLVQENFHPLFSADGGPAIEQIPQLPPWLWFGMTLGIGIAETTRVQIGWANPYEDASGKIGRANAANVQKLRDDYAPGQLGFDPLGLAPTDPAEFRIMQEKELSHGRLAMLAAAGFMAQEAVMAPPGARRTSASRTSCSALSSPRWRATKQQLEARGDRAAPRPRRRAIHEGSGGREHATAHASERSRTMGVSTGRTSGGVARVVRSL